MTKRGPKKPIRVSWRISREAERMIKDIRKRHKLDSDGEAVDHILKNAHALEIEREKAIGKVKEIITRWGIKFDEIYSG